METKNKKMAYESPALKVVRFQVEKGFATSFTPSPSSASTQDVAGDQLTEASEGTWGTFN